MTINRPSVIAFWMTPTSNDTLAADPDLASALDEHQLLTHTGVLDVAAPNVDKSTKVLIQIGGAGADRRARVITHSLAKCRC